jgi:hypothetical protein
MDLAHTNSRAGFGFFHDGGVDTLVRFVQDAFDITNDQTTADLSAFLLSISGSDLIAGSITDVNRSPGVSSLDTPAAAGRQITLNNSNRVALLDSMVALANSSTSRVELIAKGFKNGLPRGWFYVRTNGSFQSDRLAEVYSPDALRALAGVGSEQTYTLVPAGSGIRVGIDEDGDGFFDRDELDYGSDPRNPLSIPPPVLGPLTNLTVLKGRLLTLTFTAREGAGPAIRALTFSLSNAPPSAVVNPTNGVFNWVPSGPPGPMTNNITVVVMDNGTPNQSDSGTFTVTAVDLTMGSMSLDTNGTTLRWSALPGIIYQLQYKTQLTDPVWLNVSGGMTTTNSTALALDPTPATNQARFYRIVALP